MKINLIKPAYIFLMILTGIGVATCKKDQAPEIKYIKLSTKPVSSITSNSAVSGGVISSDGGSAITESGICWGASADVTIDNAAGKTTDGIKGIGEFNSTMTGLTFNTTYFVRSYATNAKGTMYGPGYSFTTSADIPSVITGDLTSITSSSVTVGGNITGNGGSEVTESGICWSSNNAEPTTNNSKTSTNGVKTGIYTITLGTLQPGTKYYVRAYAANLMGTNYGEVKSFSTNSAAPIVTTGFVTTQNAKDYTIEGDISSNGGSLITEMGICWSLNPDPTIADNKVSVTPLKQSGNFSGTINVPNGIIVYVRAYASNTNGVSYGQSTTITGGDQ